MSVFVNGNCQHITVQKNVIIMGEFNCLKGAVACPLSGPADGGKSKWATFMAYAMAGNFGFRGLIGLSGLDFFGSFWGNAKKNNGK